jgi:hypothetical protein
MIPCHHHHPCSLFKQLKCSKRDGAVEGQGNATILIFNQLFIKAYHVPLKVVFVILELIVLCMKGASISSLKLMKTIFGSSLPPVDTKLH